MSFSSGPYGRSAPPSGDGRPPGAANGVRVAMFIQAGLGTAFGLLALVSSLVRLDEISPAAGRSVAGEVVWVIVRLGLPLAVLCLSVMTLVLAARLGPARPAVRTGALVLESAMAVVNGIVVAVGIGVANANTGDAQTAGIVLAVIFLVFAVIAVILAVLLRAR